MTSQQLAVILQQTFFSHLIQQIFFKPKEEFSWLKVVSDYCNFKDLRDNYYV